MTDINTLRNRVNSLAQGMFEDSQLSEDGSLWISYDSTALNVEVVQVTEGLDELADKLGISKSFVQIRAIVLLNVKVTNELNETIANWSPTDLLPGVSLYLSPQEAGTANIIACAVLSAEDLDESELRTGLMSVAVTSNYLDDEMKGQFGGTRVGD
jgi:hypothetical protein